VVTFRRIDPLYLVDLSEPTAPQVTGELDPQSLEELGFAPFTHTEFTRTERTPGPVSD
jgi:uncharacterized secreted protein with C-terminal beta-propeller domain